LQSSHEKIHSRQLIIPEEQEDSLPREHCDNACQCSRHLPGTFMMSQQCHNNACMRNTHQKN
jgi:hypothetical protein